MPRAVQAATERKGAVSFPWLLAVADPETSEGLDPYLDPMDVQTPYQTYNYLDTVAPSGPEEYLTAPAQEKDAVYTFQDSSGVTMFVSNAVPSGKQWNLNGAWNFSIWVKTSEPMEIDWFQAKVYKVLQDGSVAFLWTNISKSSTYATSSASWTNATWSDSCSQCTLTPGERWGVEIQLVPKDAHPSATATLAYNDATHSSSVVTPLVESNAPAAVRVNHYRIGKDTPLGAMEWYGATDTAIVDLPRGVNFRLRYQIYNDGASNLSWTPRLQFALDDPLRPAGSGGMLGWTTAPVCGAGHFCIADTTQYAHGATIPASTFALGSSPGSVVDGIAWDTANSPAYTLPAMSYTEIEFSLRNASGTGFSYLFRLTNGGSPLSVSTQGGSYFVWAGVTKEPASGMMQSRNRVGRDLPWGDANYWYSNTNAPARLERDVNFRMRFQLYNVSGAAATVVPRLDYATRPVYWGYGTEVFAPVPTSAGTSPVFVNPSTSLDNAAPIPVAQFELPTPTIGTPVPGVAYDTQNPGASILLNGNQFTEVEFSVKANPNPTYAASSANYYMRLSNNGTPFIAAGTPYPNYGTIIIQDTPLARPTAAAPAHNNHQQFDANTSACAGCHRVHTAKANQALLKREWPAHQTCFTCHDGMGGPNIKTQFYKTYAMPLLGTGHKHQLSEARNLGPASQLSGDNRHVECTDCHNPHKAARGNHVVGQSYTAGPQQGIWGLGVNWNAPWMGPTRWPTPTYVPVRQVTYMYELCFKCHSAWSFGSNPPINPSGGFWQTDQSKEFDPLNAAFMPVAGQARNPFIYEGGGYTGSYAQSLINGMTPKSLLTCADCHGSEQLPGPGAPTPTGTPPVGGPHGSTNPFILRRPWNRSTGENSNNDNRQDTNNHLCFMCHDYDTYTNPNVTGEYRTGFKNNSNLNLHGMHVGSKRNVLNDWNPIVCMDCHVAVPHGWFRRRLLGFSGSPYYGIPSDPAPYINRPGGLSIIDRFAPSGQWSEANCATAMGECR